MTTGFYLDSDLSVYRLLKSKIKLALKSFSTALYFGLFMEKGGQICPFIKWNQDKVMWEVKTLNRMVDCYKYLIPSLFDYSSAWTGRNAVWLDNCEFPKSDSTAYFEDVPLITTKVAPEMSQLLFGGDDIDKPFCFQFARWSKWAPFVASAIETYGSTGAYQVFE